MDFKKAGKKFLLRLEYVFKQKTYFFVIIVAGGLRDILAWSIIYPM